MTSLFYEMENNPAMFQTTNQMVKHGWFALTCAGFIHGLQQNRGDTKLLKIFQSSKFTLTWHHLTLTWHNQSFFWRFPQSFPNLSRIFPVHLRGSVKGLWEFAQGAQWRSRRYRGGRGGCSGCHGDRRLRGSWGQGAWRFSYGIFGAFLWISYGFPMGFL